MDGPSQNKSKRMCVQKERQKVRRTIYKCHKDDDTMTEIITELMTVKRTN